MCKKWNPIETAPRNKRIILKFGSLDHAEDGEIYIDGEDIRYSLFDGEAFDEFPTGWIEYPED